MCEGGSPVSGEGAELSVLGVVEEKRPETVTGLRTGQLDSQATSLVLVCILM